MSGDQAEAAAAPMNEAQGDQTDDGDNDLSFVVKGLRFSPPEKFDGTENKFEFFAMKLRSYLCLSNVKFQNFLTESENATDSIDWDLLDADQQPYSNMLQHVLINLCTGLALRLVQRNKKQENGFESWR